MTNKKVLRGIFLVLGIVVLAASIKNLIHRTKEVRKPVPAKEVMNTDFMLPDLPAAFPALMVRLSDDDSASIPFKLNTLKLNVNVMGNLVFSTMEMTFYNGTDRNLEGQFYFPLAEGQSVTRFAMETNGELREGVVVEKTKGRTTYESLVRKNIDPGLLEWAEGNNFKARIFPIPAKGFKRLVIGYTHELIATKSLYLYWQPMAFEDTIDNFGLKVTVQSLNAKPEEKDDKGMALDFEEKNDSWVSETNIKNYKASLPIRFEIPASEFNNKIFVEKFPDSDSFYFYGCFQPQKFEREKSTPSKIGIIWDVSSSGENRDKKKEMNLIRNYLGFVKNVEVLLIPFANECFMAESFQIKDGNCSALIRKIEMLIYDGGTQLGCLDLERYKVDEFMMFSDGISNFGKHEPLLAKIPVNTFASVAGADFSYLKFIAQKSNGQFNNISSEDSLFVLEKLKKQLYRYLSTTVAYGNATEIYPSIPTDFSRGFSFAGKMKGKASELKLNFGFGSESSKCYYIRIDRKNKVNSGTISKVWAQKKIDELDMLPEMNLKTITDLGLKYGLVTRNTSLLVLDQLDDYVQHNVLPPTGIMREQFLEISKNMKEFVETEKRDHLIDVVAMFNTRKKWWKSKFDWPKKKEVAPEINDFLPSDSMIENRNISVNETSIIGYDTTVLHGASNWTSNYKVEDGTYSFSFGSTSATQTNNWSNHFYSNSETSEPEAFHQATISLNNWEPNAPYLKLLKSVNKNTLYQTYLRLKAKNKNTPAYFFDAADVFIGKGMYREAIRVLSNIAELELENHELLRTLAHRLQQLKKYELAIAVFKDVLKIRAEEPQSYRDLGLAYADNKQYQLAIDMLCKVINTNWDDRFPEIEVIAVGEANQIVAKSPTKLNVKSLDKRLQQNLKTDIRVTIDWDSDNCDIDLWIIDPTGEKTYYSHPFSSIGGKLSRDFTGGYGPEEFLIKKAMPGRYKVQVDYYGSSRQTLSGPATIHAQLITNAGSRNEKRKEITIRLTSEKKIIDIGELVF